METVALFCSIFNCCFRILFRRVFSAAPSMLMSPRTLSLAASLQQWRLSGFQITESNSSWLERKDLLEGCSYLTGPKGPESCMWALTRNQAPQGCFSLTASPGSPPRHHLFLSPSLFTENQLLGFSRPRDWKHVCCPPLSHIPCEASQGGTWIALIVTMSSEFVSLLGSDQQCHTAQAVVRGTGFWKWEDGESLA